MQTKQRRGPVLALLFFGVLMAAMDIAIVGPALPAIRTAFGVDERVVAWVFTAYLLFNLVGTPVMAKLSDRYGRRKVYVADVLLFVLGSLVVALAPSLPLVLVGRALQGFGAGGIFPVASAVIGDTFPPEQRGRALGLIGAVFGIAFIVGPIVGGVLLLWGWRTLFWGPVPFAVVLVPWAWRVLPDRAAAAPRPLDWSGLVLLAVGLSGLALGLNHLDAGRWGDSLRSVQVGPYLALALVALPSLWWVEHRAEDPLIRPVLFRPLQLRRAYLLTFGAGVVEGAMVFIPAMLVDAFAVTPSKASFMLAPVVLSLAVGAPLFGWLLDLWGARVVILMGTALLTVGGVVVGWLPFTVPVFYAGAVLVGLGLSALLGAPIRYIVINEAPVEERAAAQGLVSLVTKVGQMLIGALFGGLVVSFGGGVVGYQVAFRWLAGLTLFLFLMAWQLKPRQEEPAR